MRSTDGTKAGEYILNKGVKVLLLDRYRRSEVKRRLHLMIDLGYIWQSIQVVLVFREG